MPIALWSDQFEIGIDVIDAQHQELFEALNRLADSIHGGAAGKGIEEKMASIAQRTIKHFQTEETLMKEMGYPIRVQHADQHAELILRVRGLQYNQARGRSLTLDAAEFLVNWFDHHIKESDMGYVEHLKASQHS